MNFGEAFHFWLAKLAVEMVVVGSLIGVTLVGLGIAVTVIQLYTIFNRRNK